MLDRNRLKIKGKEGTKIKKKFVCEVLYNLCETRNLIFFGSSLFLHSESDGGSGNDTGGSGADANGIGRRKFLCSCIAFAASAAEDEEG